MYTLDKQLRIYCINIVSGVLEFNLYPNKLMQDIERFILDQETQIISLISRLNADVCSLVFTFLNTWSHELPPPETE